MNKNTGTFLAFLSFLLISVVFVIRTAFAAQSTLQLSPFLIQQDTDRGQQFSQVITVTNNSEAAKYLTVSLNDFLPYGTDGETQILPPDQSTPNQVSLAKWINIDTNPEYSLQPGQTTQMKFTVKVPVDAEAGAHFGALLFTLSDQLPLPGQSLVRQQSATLVVVDVGRSHEDGSLTSVKLVSSASHSGQLEFLSTFKNSGTSSLRPKGRILIYDFFHRLVGIAYINPDANLVLPQTERIFVSHLPGQFWGRYTAEATVTYASKRLESKLTFSFWIWPPVVSLIWFGIYLLLGVTLITVIIKRYNAWIRSRPEKS